MEKPIKKNPNYPVYVRIIGDDKPCASGLGIGHRMEDLGMMTAQIETIQKIDGAWVVVNTNLNGKTLSR